jgi:hypothetical protein
MVVYLVLKVGKFERGAKSERVAAGASIEPEASAHRSRRGWRTSDELTEV